MNAMPLVDEFEKSGNTLFRWRSYIPILMIALILAAGAWAGLTGCSDSSSGEFHEFGGQEPVKSLEKRRS